VSLTNYAEVLTDEHPSWQAYRNGSKPTPPGRPLHEVLVDTEGRYEDTVALPERVMVDVRRAAAADPADAALAAVAQLGRVRIPLDSFRGLAPDTRVVYGFSLTPSRRPTLRHGKNGRQGRSTQAVRVFEPRRSADACDLADGFGHRLAQLLADRDLSPRGGDRRS
jgi:hypothetical protein